MVEKAALVNFHLLCYTFFVAVCVLQGMKFFKGDRKSMKIEMKMRLATLSNNSAMKNPNPSRSLIQAAVMLISER